jgi:hypothetical protein
MPYLPPKIESGFLKQKSHPHCDARVALNDLQFFPFSINTLTRRPQRDRLQAQTEQLLVLALSLEPLDLSSLTIKLGLGLLNLLLLLGLFLLLALDMIPDEGTSYKPDRASNSCSGSSTSCGRTDDSS